MAVHLSSCRSFTCPVVNGSSPVGHTPASRTATWAVEELEWRGRNLACARTSRAVMARITFVTHAAVDHVGVPNRVTEARKAGAVPHGLARAVPVALVGALHCARRRAGGKSVDDPWLQAQARYAQRSQERPVKPDAHLQVPVIRSHSPRLLHSAGRCASSTSTASSAQALPKGHWRCEQSPLIHPASHSHTFIGLLQRPWPEQ